MISRLLVERQRKTGTNRKDFCMQYSIPYQTYAKVETGYQKCSQPLQKKLAQIFQVKEEELFEDGFVKNWR